MVVGVPISSDSVKVRQLFSANSGDEYILEPDATPKQRVQCTLSTTLHTRSSQSLGHADVPRFGQVVNCRRRDCHMQQAPRC
jgi:hypothetical protein